MSKVLITGGFGFIGSAIAKRLVDRGDSVTLFDNAQRGRLSNIASIASRVKIVRGDIRNQKQLFDNCRGKDIVYHLAAVNGTRYFYEKPGEVLEINTEGLISCVKAAAKARVKKMLFSSTSELYQLPTRIPTPETEPVTIPDVKNPRFTYSTTKLLGEMYCLHYLPKKDLDVRIVRYHNVYGPAMGEEHVIPQLIKKCLMNSQFLKKKKIALPLQGRGQTTRSFCFIDDAVTATILAVDRGLNREVYNVGTQDEIKISELATRLARVMGLGVSIQGSALPPGDVSRRCPDVRLLNKIGYKPRVKLEEGLQQSVDWYTEFFKKSLKA